MALIIENGLQITGAESYASVADFDDYWTKRNDATTVALTTAAKEAALRQATAYLDANWTYIGERCSTLQALAWPRVLPDGLDADRRSISSTEIPLVLIQATCELAKEAASADLAPSLERGGAVKSKTVDVISITYADGAQAAKKYQLVELLLRHIISGGGNSISQSVARA